MLYLLLRSRQSISETLCVGFELNKLSILNKNKEEEKESKL